MFSKVYFTKFSTEARLLLLCTSVANSTSIVMATVQKDITKKPRLVLTEHPKQELEHWKQSLGRHLPVVDCTVLCTSPRGTAGVMLLCVIQRAKAVLLSCFIMYFSLELSKEYEPHIPMHESLDSAAATQIMETLVSYQKVGRKFLYCLPLLLKTSHGYWWAGDLQKEGLPVSHDWAHQTQHHSIWAALPAKGNVVNLSEQLILAKFVRACQES